MATVVHSYHYPPWVRVPAWNLTQSNCTDGVPWIRDVIGTCVLNQREYAAVMVGLMSTLLSTVNGLPQIWLNCAKGIPDKALSLLLILQWLAGDALNLTGALLTGQTMVQLIYATFMVSVDVIMLTQYTFFKIKHAYEDRELARSRSAACIQDSTMAAGAGSRSYDGSVLFCWLAFTSFAYLGLGGIAPPPQLAAAVLRRPGGRSLLMAEPFFHGTEDKIGFGMGVVSTICYMGSRIPQIYKNYQRQSTFGVSFGLFFLMILSNCCYGSSVLLHSTELMQVLHSMPWILGALGMVAFDLFIMFQFWLYRNRDHVILLEDTTSTERLIDGV